MSINNFKKEKGLTRIVDFRLTKILDIFAWRKLKFSQSRKFTTGFTLVELMVAVSIFAIVVMIAMGAIFTVVDANKKAQSLKSVMNNLNFALETMTRTIKTGQIQSGTNNDLVNVIDQNNKNVVYELGGENGTQIMRSIGGGGFVAITAPEVKIESLKFYPTGLDVGDGKQPMIVMVIKRKVQMNEKISSEFNIQTTITQRLLDS